MSDAARAVARRLKLSEPIHDAGRTITELEFAKPKARIYRLIDSLNDIGGDQVLAIIADLCGISEEAVCELDWDDTNEAAAIVGELLKPKKKGRRPTGPRRKAGGKS